MLPNWAHTPAYYAARAAIGALQTFPVDQNLRTMRAVGERFARAPFNRARLQRAVDNLAWCFPNWPDELHRRYAVDAYRRLFALAVEVAYTQRLVTQDGWPDRMVLEHIEPLVGRVLHAREDHGGPVIFITGHCGNWEVLGYALAVLGFPVHALYRPLDLKPLDRWLRETRERTGLILLDKFGATQRAPHILNNNEHLAFIADQNAGDKGLFVPFFNRLASTYKSIGLLAMQHRAPIVCGVARAIGLDDHASPPIDAQLFRYRLELVDIITPEDWDAHEDPLFYLTARYRRAIEEMVRRAPEQYLWMHRYWKSRPPHERARKPFPPALRDKIASLPWITPEDLDRIVDRSNRDAAELSPRR